MNNINFFVPILIGYLIGSIPFGLIICFFFGNGDIRTQGSCNIGTTNVLRIVGKKAALLTLCCDMGKAMLVTLYFYHQSYFFSLLAGLSAVMGHNFSLFLKGKGGKGIATTLAVFFIWNKYLAIFSISVWLIVAYISHYSSLASLFMLCLAPFFSFVFINNLYLTLSVIFLSIIGFIRHHSNITRLFCGKEKKIKLKNHT